MHHRARLLSAALIAALAGAPGPVAGQVRNFKHYTAFEGLPQAQVLGIAQDTRGYIWLASYAGLSRFNGAGFLTLTTSDGLVSNSVFDVAIDERGRLVVGTSDGVCVLDGERFQCVGEEDGLTNDYVRSVAPDGAGGIWVGTSLGVSHVGPGGIRNWGHRQGLPSDRVTRVAIDPSGGVWAATDEGLARLEGDAFVSAYPEHFDAREVNFVRRVEGGLLIGSEGRLFLCRGDDVSQLPVDVPEHMRLTDGTIDVGGTMWLSARGGVLRVSGDRVQVLTERNGLLSDLVNRVWIDSEGDVWFGTESGASKHSPGPFTTYTETEGLPNPFARAVELDSAGRIWVGTRDGVAVFEDDRFREIALAGVTDRRVYGLGVTPDGGMLVGLRGSLAWVKDGAVRSVYREKDGLPGNVVYALLQDGRGGLWIATDRGLARWSEGRIERIDHPEMNRLSILSMTMDGRGRLWLGLTSGGVAVWDGASLEQIGPDQGMSGQSVWAVAVDEQDRVWAGTNGDGAYRFGPGGVERFTTAHGLASDFVWQILPDSHGDIWLFGNVGLDRMSGESITHYGTGSGLIELEGSVSAAHEDASGNLWFGTGKGIVRYTPGLDQPPAVRPPVYVESFTHEGEPVGLSRLGTLQTDRRIRLRSGAVRIAFGSPSYRDESAIRYRYRLRGATETWSVPATERSITYAGLEPGHYTFEVVAENRGLASLEPATFGFTIMPAFWQTWWFRLPAFLALAGLAGVVPAWRANRLEKERRRLEALVAHHTRELAEKNERLEHSNRDLEHFAYVASHDLQEPLRKIRAFSDRVSRRYAGVLDDQGRDYLARTENAASRMQRLIDDLLSLSRVTTRKQPMQTFALGQLTRDVIADLEIRIQSTGGRVEVGDLPEIEADPAQIRQLMQNLIGNALKFHRPDVAPVVRVSATDAGHGRIEIRVEDNGIGFESREADKLFLPFQRLHSRMQYEGTGIGLSICQKIVERHGGSIRAESEPGVGSTFIVIIPQRQPRMEAHAA